MEYGESLNSFDEAYLIDEDVYLYDTYYDYDFDEELTYYNPVTSARIGSNDVMYQLNSFCGVCTSNWWAFPNSEYDKFQEHSFGAKTVVGKLIQSAIGNNTGFTINFSDNYRLKAKLYAFNYRLYQSVGLKVKMQKKGWTGFWAKHKDSRAEKLVVGWDALLLTLNHPVSMDISYTKLPSTEIANEILKFTNFHLSATALTDARIIIGQKKIADYDMLEKALNKQVKTSLKKITELVWKEAEKEFANNSYQIKQENVKAYRKIFPNKTKMMFGRFESVSSNSNEINLNIDRSFMVGYKSNQKKTLLENILLSVVKNKTLYEIDGASVYAGAKFSNQIKGIRIIKELDND